jgi:hypothetical protein
MAMVRSVLLAGAAEMPAQQGRGFSSTSWSLSAIRPSSGREWAFLFRITLLRVTFAVVSAMPISPAICLPRRPCATWIMISRSPRLSDPKRSLTAVNAFTLSPSATTRRATLDRVEKFLVTERLRSKFDSAAPHRLHRNLNIAMPRDENYWEMGIRFNEQALQIKVALPFRCK